MARNREPGVTLEQIADFGDHPTTLSKWLRRADTDEGGAKPTTAAGESADRAARAPPLFAGHRLGPSWMLCPSATDPAVAREWLYEWTEVPGGEGVAVKSLTGRNRPGVRGWTRAPRRNSAEALIGDLAGFLHRPQVLLLGRFDITGRLCLAGRTVR
ncbi:hypothetical protein ACN6LM_000052 [Streptomyces sp. SAS_281]|uniref:hypothetical protein n=1 Tax=Streptomyces sp. SAS_281 TaxID=3412744 RepID=UPI00403C675A